MRYAQILSTGRYVPERVMTNAEFDQLLGEPVSDWLAQNVGIRERHFMAPDQTTSDLAAVASRVALDRASIPAADLDLILVATDTPDYISPATASVLQAKLGAVKAGTFDLNCACAAWVTGLDIAGKYIASDEAYKYILVVGAYGMSRYIDWKDKTTATLFADGAGAVVIGAGDHPGFLTAKLIANGEYHDALGIYTGGISRPATAENVATFGPPFVKFVRKFPKTFNSERWPILVRDVLAKAGGVSPDEVNQYYFTQLNLRTIELVMQSLNQPISKTHWIMDKWGYTGSACIPMALDDAIEVGREPKPGDLVMFCGSGGGLAMAAALWKWVEAMYIGDYLGRRAIYSPDQLALVDTGKNPEWRLTYREMNERANKFANYLLGIGVGKGDRVAIFARDGIEHLDCFFACSKLGAIHTALNWRLHWREAQGIVENTTPKVLIYSDDFKATIADLQKAVQHSQFEIQNYLHLEGVGLAKSTHFETALQSGAATPVTCESLEAEDITALIFTGGTTGLPKAAEVSHRMIAWNTLNTVIHDVTHKDVYLNVFPMFHTGGLFVYTLPQVIFGGTTILIHQFDAALVLNLIEREKVTIFGGVPAQYQMLTQAVNWPTADLSSLRFCTSGGAPLPVPLVEKYTWEKGIRFKQGFGMTEFGPGIFALAPEDAIRKAGSIGRPNFFVDARVVDDENHPLGANEIGELVLKGPSYCSGYFHNAEANAGALDAAGWFHTGDLAKYDDEWYFFIVDRKKDMFLSGGENIYPVEIEKVLYQHAAVHMCAVVGVPDAKWGEVGQAFVVLKPGTKATAEELLEHCRANLARYKVPRSIVFLDALPISSAGKILKRELKEKYA